MLFEGFYPTQIVGLTGCTSSVLFTSRSFSEGRRPFRVLSKEGHLPRPAA
jgi:hypothetical protein